MSIQQKIVLAVIAAAALTGCAPAIVGDRVKLAVPESWRHTPEVKAAADPVDLKTWWQGFNDPVLNELIVRALAANHDLKIAQARVREAAALRIVAESALYPGIDFTASGGREKKIDRIIGVPGQQGIELITPTADAVSGGLSARWEIDLFGAKHLQAEAAAAQALGSEEARRAVQVGLLAQVAGNYLELRGVQQRIDILNATIALLRERLRAVQTFYRAGLANDGDIARQQTALHNTEAALPALNQAAQTLIHRLGVLLGELPAHGEARLARPAPPTALPAIPVLLPAELLAQRPDLRLAQTEVRAAAASLGAAQADLFPKLVLSASGGFGALAVGGFPSLAESVYTLGAGLSAPIFNAGRIRAHIAATDARLALVAANYEKSFLLALEDVENAYVARSTALARRAALASAATAADRACRQAVALYQQGAGDYLAVLDAKRDRLAVDEQRAQAETAARIATVSLYRAFGGGWNVETVANKYGVGKQ